MPKYKNIKQFSKPLLLAGKRILIKPNEIIFSDRDLDLRIYDFLEQVDDKFQVSQVKELSPQKISIPSTNDVKNLKNKIEDVKKEVSNLQTTPKEIAEVFVKIDSLQKDIDSIMKKLNIMKDAVQQTTITLQTVSTLVEDTASAVKILEHEVYENGDIIITGLDEEPA